MPSLQIRDLPEEIHQALAARAEAEHRSLAQQAIVELRRIPEMVARESRLAVLREVRRRIATEPMQRFSSSPDVLIREDRDR